MLHEYAAGELDAPARAEVERLLRSDPRAHALLEEIERAHGALQARRDRPEPPVSAEDVIPRIRAAIAAQRFAPKPRLYLEGEGTRLYRRVAMAATFLLAVSVSFLATRRGELAPRAPSTGDAASPDRGIGLLIDAGVRGGMSADEWFDLLRDEGMKPEEAVVTPLETVFPVSAESPRRR
ncbi:MAG: hypothetical protein ACREID_08795 [Planctomycetota bacterium]